ncbi:MAG: histidine--tRNA ligase [Alphaproteobacteria bacterium]|nr:histidine--tRNA ligase [Alphaproteobacteria bacterium]
MSAPKQSRPKARLPRGFRDRGAAEIMAEQKMLATIRAVYESYGFEPLETPAFEYTDALGKFLPDVDRPNAGVFSLKDDDEQWMSLRYDLTAPLARHVAANFQHLAKPFRRYQTGSVWRNEKPGPGRYREFTQFDADTVGSASPSADAELLMMVSDVMEALGLQRGDYIIKLNNRKLLDGVLEASGVALDDREKRGIVLRAIDKIDRLGVEGVQALLGEGRKDDSGDFTKGAGLSPDQAHRILAFVAPDAQDEEEHLQQIGTLISTSAVGAAGLNELEQIVKLLHACGYGPDRILFDTGVVRGLDYYTGAVFEAQLTFPIKNEDGEEVVFGSVAGGGRYDDLVARFTGQAVPATGVSIGVSRLMSALASRGALAAVKAPLVVVTVFDKAEAAASFAIVQELRAAGIRAEAYVGTGKMGDQFKYADKRGAAIAIIEGGDERARGEVTLKDLALGAELAKSVESRAEWVGNREAQKSVKRADLVAEVRAILGPSSGIKS